MSTGWIQFLFIVLIALMAISALLIYAFGIKIGGNGTGSAENSVAEKRQLMESIKTLDEKILDTGTTPAPAVQAGFPGNTLPPAKTNTDFPVADQKITSFAWNNIPKKTKKIYVGAKMTGPFTKLRALAYFIVLQTPPTQVGDIYGDISIFVEGGKIGIRLLPGSHIFDYPFDFRHDPKEYRIEACIHFDSAFTTRVELWVDGANTGHSFTIRNENMRDKIMNLSPTIVLGKKVKSAYLQAAPITNPVTMNEIVELDLNRI